LFRLVFSLVVVAYMLICPTGYYRQLIKTVLGERAITVCFVTKQSGFTSATYVQMGASGFPHHFSARPFTSSVRERSQSLPKRAQSERVQKVLSL